MCIRDRAKVRADFKQRRDDMFKVGVGITNPQELPEKLNVIKEEKQQALAGFLTADQLEKYNKHHGSTRVFSFAGDGQEGIAGAVGRALNFSINIPDGEAGPVPEIQAITIDASAEGAPVFLNGRRRGCRHPIRNPDYLPRRRRSHHHPI